MGLGWSANAQDVGFRGLPTSICWENEKIIFSQINEAGEGSEPRFEKRFELFSGGVLFQSGTWKYNPRDYTIRLKITAGTGKGTTVELSNVKVDKFGFLMSAEFRFDSQKKANYTKSECAK